MDPFYDKVSQWLGVGKDEIFITEGVSGAIKALIETLTLPGMNNIVFPYPTFALYPVYCQMFDVKPRFISYKHNYELDFEQLTTAINEETSIVFLPNPNMPIEGTIEINGDISRLELRKSEFNTIPNTFALHPAYPNPFNPVTTISFSIPNIGETNSNASLAVYDLSGSVVETLLDGKIQPGIHTVKWDAGDFPSGVYFVKLETDNHFKTNKVLLIK